MSFAFKKRIIKLRSRFIRSRAQRRAYFDHHIEELVSAEVAAQKWGVSYSVFDGEELLEASIRSIRDEVDYVNVVYQTKSWYGNPASPELLPTLKKLRAEGLIDELIEYVPDISKLPGRQERAKRNMGLRAARKAGVRYFMPMDCDEFYEKPALQVAKRYIIRHQIDYAYCGIVCYGFAPTHRLLKVVGSGVQFFSRIGRWSSLKTNQNIIAFLDASRQLGYPLFGCRQYYLTNVVMHHMSFLRKDIQKKVDNYSAVGFFDKNPLQTEYSENEYALVENIFNIDMSGW